MSTRSSCTHVREEIGTNTGIRRWDGASSARSGFDLLRSGGYGAPMTKRRLPIGIRTFRIAEYEGYYASVFYSRFAAAGPDVRAEDSASRKRLDSHGRPDMAVLSNGQVHLFEFKPVEKEPEGTAPAQIGEKGYAGNYRRLGQPIHLIGVEFSREERNVTAFAVARA